MASAGVNPPAVRGSVSVSKEAVTQLASHLRRWMNLLAGLEELELREAVYT